MIFSMFSTRWRVALLTIAVCLPIAAPARAGSLPPRAEVGLTSGVETELFRRLVASRYHVEFRIVVAADVDQDGDLDVVAATDRSVTVWVNDGAGHLRVNRLPHRPAMTNSGPGNTWQGSGDRIDPTIQAGGAHLTSFVARAHAPPQLDTRTLAAAALSLSTDSHTRRSAPRAPPA
jgi:VCBS repeat protein